MGVDVGPARDLADIRRRVSAHVRRSAGSAPPSPVLRGFGWFPAQLPGGSPRREWLDELTGDVPMVLTSADFHDLWFNTAAMREAGISRDTPDPEANQYYVRDDDGVPTGHAVEGAATLPILASLGTFSVETIRTSQQLTLDRAPSYGITTYFEAGLGAGETSSSGEPLYRDFVARDLAGTLPLRVAGTVWTRSESDGIADVAANLLDWNHRIRSPHVSVSHLKIWADGTLLSGGARLLEPSCGSHPRQGRMTFSEDYLTELIATVQRQGFDAHIHVDADGSARTVLNAIERAQRDVRGRPARHVIAHNSLVAPEDIPRYRELGVIANCTPLWGTDYQGIYRRAYTDLLGPARVEERLFPYGDLVRSGAVVTYGADLPGVNLDEIPPLLHIEAAMTRQRPGVPGDPPLVPRQRVGLMDALRAATLNGAFQLRMEQEIGSIEAGKRADLVLLGEDLRRVPAEAIHTVPVRMTLMDGRVTFREE